MKVLACIIFLFIAILVVSIVANTPAHCQAWHICQVYSTAVENSKDAASCKLIFYEVSLFEFDLEHCVTRVGRIYQIDLFLCLRCTMATTVDKNDVRDFGSTFLSGHEKQVCRLQVLHGG